MHPAASPDLHRVRSGQVEQWSENASAGTSKVISPQSWGTAGYRRPTNASKPKDTPKQVLSEGYFADEHAIYGHILFSVINTQFRGSIQRKQRSVFVGPFKITPSHRQDLVGLEQGWTEKEMKMT